MHKSEKNDQIDNVLNDAYKRIDAQGYTSSTSGYNYGNQAAKDELRTKANNIRNAASIHRTITRGPVHHVHSHNEHHHIYHNPIPAVVHHHHAPKTTVITKVPATETTHIIQPPTKIETHQPPPKARIVEQPTELKFDPWTGDASIVKHPDQVVFDAQPKVVTVTKPAP